MSPKHKVDSTLILKRVYAAPIELVWRAWTTQEELAKWYVAGWDHVVHFAEADVRAGGTYRISFGAPGKTPCVETGHYREVVPMKRLAFQETVTIGDQQMHTNETRVDFRDLGGSTEITVTSTGFESWRSGEGWIPAMESLATHLAA
jgi:uncharacterized protein YndB with AHSA1/START domain